MPPSVTWIGAGNGKSIGLGWRGAWQGLELKEFLSSCRSDSSSTTTKKDFASNLGTEEGPQLPGCQQCLSYEIYT